MKWAKDVRSYAKTKVFCVDRELSMLHMDALAKFKRSTPHLEFPALHKELFSVDSWVECRLAANPALSTWTCEVSMVYYWWAVCHGFVAEERI
jgi:hypothetical protein